MSMTVDSVASAANMASEIFGGPLEQRLNEADAKLGDGDTGVTLRRVFERVRQAAQAPQPDLGAAFAACGRASAEATGSSLGTLCAIALIQAGRHCAGKSELPWLQLGALLDACLQAMMQRGQAALGDKTVLDALQAMGAAVEGLGDPARQARAAAEAGRATLEAFRARPCKTGRARMFGERSVGIDDPGMLALVCFVEEMAARMPPSPMPCAKS